MDAEVLFANCHYYFAGCLHFRTQHGNHLAKLPNLHSQGAELNQGWHCPLYQKPGFDFVATDFDSNHGLSQPKRHDSKTAGQVNRLHRWFRVAKRGEVLLAGRIFNSSDFQTLNQVRVRVYRGYQGGGVGWRLLETASQRDAQHQVQLRTHAQLQWRRFERVRKLNWQICDQNQECRWY